MLRFGLTNLRYRRITFVIYTIVLTTPVPSRLLLSSSSAKSVLISLAIGFVVTLLVLPLLFVACKVISGKRLGEKSLAYPLLILAGIGAIRGAILQGVFVSLEIVDQLSTPAAILLSTVFTVITFVGFSSVMEILIQKKESFNKIFDQSSTLLAQSSSDLMGHSSQDTYDNAVAAVKTSVNQSSDGSAQTGIIDSKSAALEIQKQINEVLRPLSHRLWVNSLGEIKHINLLSIVKDSIVDLDFNARWLLYCQATVCGLGTLMIFGIQSSLYITILSVLTSSFLILIFFKLKPRVTKHPLAFGNTFLLLMGVCPVLVPVAIRNPLNDSANLLAGLILSSTLPWLIVLASTYILISKDRDFALSAAASVGWQIASNSDLIKRADNEEEELAEYFHNSLQSELFGIAKKLENLNMKTEQKQAQALLLSLNIALDRRYQETRPDESDGLVRISKLIESWKGISSISITGLETLTGNSDLAYKVSKLMEEMITNSIRYGKATHIDFSLTNQDTNFEISLSHNGAPQVNQVAGLGSLLISRHAREGVVAHVVGDKTFYKISLT